MSTPFLRSFVDCGERLTAPCCVRQLRSFNSQGKQNPATKNKENKMKRFLCTSGLLLSAVLVITFTTQVFAASTGLKATAQLGTRNGDGPGGDVVLRDLPDMSAADMAVTRNIPSHRTPGMSQAQYEFAKSAASHTSGMTRAQDAANFRVPPASQRGDIASGTPSAFSNFLGQAEFCATGNGWIPSDMGLAVSSLYIVQAV